MDRRNFLKSSAASAALLSLTGPGSLYAQGTRNQKVGKAWDGWTPGHFQVHFIYTGVGESIFFIFPDGTTMLLDCGDHNAVGRGELAVPVLPHCGRHSGEWIARYVQRVNPNGKDVDYMMLSHYHGDHGGCLEFYASKDVRDGKEYVLSGFSQAAEFLNFHKAVDRAWPGFDDPLPMPDDFDNGAVGCIRQFYDYAIRHKGLQVEKFRLGATDQIRLLKNASLYPGFKVRNICANGRICAEDGTVTDLYAYRIRKEHLTRVNENGMSLGMIFSYGPFRFFTAGDFSDRWSLEDGSLFRVEDAIADVCGSVDVAKICHHGHHSMSPKLISSLQAKVYVNCVWDQLHTTSDVCDLMSDRSLYPGDRYICPCIMPAKRRFEDEGKEWLKDVPSSVYQGSHVILDVEPGGKRYSVNFLSAEDESMTVKSVMRFDSKS